MLWLPHCFFTFSLPPKHMYLKTHQKWTNPPTQGRWVCKSDSELFLRLWWWKGSGSPQAVLRNKDLILIWRAMLGFAVVVRGAQRGRSLPPSRWAVLTPPHSPSPGTGRLQRYLGGDAGLAPQQHPQHKPRLRHWAVEEKSGGSSGLTLPSEGRVLLRAQERALRCTGAVVPCTAAIRSSGGMQMCWQGCAHFIASTCTQASVCFLPFSPIPRCRLGSCPRELLGARERVCRRRWREQGCQGTLMRASSILVVQLRVT